jgi:MFS family permease
MAQDADRPLVSRVADRSAAAPGVAGPAGPVGANQESGRRWLTLFGRKRMLIIGMVGFAAASALGGTAIGFGMLLAGAAVHSYVVAFWVSAGIFAGAAVVCGLVLRTGVLTRQVAVTQAAATVPA